MFLNFCNGPVRPVWLTGILGSVLRDVRLFPGRKDTGTGREKYQPKFVRFLKFGFTRLILTADDCCLLRVPGALPGK
jgi:hypothetical protein